MRKALVLAVLVALGAGGVAYAAIQNVYVVKANITPTKSGTKKTPKPIAISREYDVAAVPSFQTPQVVANYTTLIVGVQENTNDFPGCGTSKLNNPSEGPGKCPRGSKIGVGYVIVTYTPASTTLAAYAKQCRLETTLFNGGDHTVSIYFYKGKQQAGNPAPCPLPRSIAVSGLFSKGTSGLVERVTVPPFLRHPIANQTWVFTKYVTIIPLDKTTITKKVHGKKHKVQVGFFETYACPANHQRLISVDFTNSFGVTQRATRNVACT